VLSAWWPVCVLVYVPNLVRTAAMILFMRGARRLDVANPDDLPHTAGEWLELEIIRLGLVGKVRAIVTDEDAKISIDAFHPLHRTIQLTSNTHFKRDAVQWAIAAHELGHARFWLGWPVVARAIIGSRFVRELLVALGLGVAYGNVLYALPGATAFAFWCLAAAAALQIMQLVDEGVASILAMRSLRASTALGPHHLRAARGALVLAFMTYALAALAYASLLTQWRLIERLTAVPLVPPTATLTPLGLVAAACATIVLAAFAVVCVTTAVRRHAAMPGAFVVAWQIALAGFIWLVWNHSADPTYARFAMLAIAQVVGLVIVALVMPMAVLDAVLLRRVTKRLAVDFTHETDELRRDRRVGYRLMREGNAAFAKLIERGRMPPMLEHRLRLIAWLSYVPLVIAFWR
jgi:hypothetical protein